MIAEGDRLQRSRDGQKFQRQSLFQAGEHMTGKGPAAGQSNPAIDDVAEQFHGGLLERGHDAVSDRLDIRIEDGQKFIGPHG